MLRVSWDWPEAKEGQMEMQKNTAGMETIPPAGALAL